MSARSGKYGELHFVDMWSNVVVQKGGIRSIAEFRLTVRFLIISTSRVEQTLAVIYVPNFVKLLSIEAEPDHKTDALVSVNVGFQSTFWWWSSAHRYPLECQGASLLIAGKPNTCCEIKINLSPPLIFCISPTAVQLVQQIETNRLTYRSLLVLNLLGSFP